MGDTWLRTVDGASDKVPGQIRTLFPATFKRRIGRECNEPILSAYGRDISIGGKRINRHRFQ